MCVCLFDVLVYLKGDKGATTKDILKIDRWYNDVYHLLLNGTNGTTFRN